MENQENLEDYFGNAPELSFYKYKNFEKPILIFKCEDGFWKARNYVKGAVVDMKLSQLYFEGCLKIADKDVEELMSNYEKSLKELRLSFEDKKLFSGLENKTEASA